MRTFVHKFVIVYQNRLGGLVALSTLTVLIKVSNADEFKIVDRLLTGCTILSWMMLRPPNSMVWWDIALLYSDLQTVLKFLFLPT